MIYKKISKGGKKKMKKIGISILIVLVVILFTSCWTGMEIGWLTINDFIIPDDYEFLILIEKLFTPFLIAAYMQNNFEYEYSRYAKTPYQLWKIKKGDCNDFALFATFVARYHGYEAYMVRIFFEDQKINQWIGVYWEEIISLYTCTSNQYLLCYVAKDIESLVNIISKFSDKNWLKYEVYDDMNIVEEKYNLKGTED